MAICPTCGEDPCGVYPRCRYPYTHHGPTVYGSKLMDYLISELSLEEDDAMRCAECDCENGGADCNWIKPGAEALGGSKEG